MNYHQRPRAEGETCSSSGGPQHRGADSFDCRPEKYVLLPNSYLKELFSFDHYGQ